MNKTWKKEYKISINEEDYVLLVKQIIEWELNKREIEEIRNHVLQKLKDINRINKEVEKIYNG